MKKTYMYLATTTALEDAELYNDLYKNLPEWRKAKADNLKFNKDKILSVAAFSLLMEALKDQFGYEKGKKLINLVCYDSNGKPIIQNEKDIYISLSHSGNQVACALSEVEVGCDIENIRDCKQSVANRFFHKEEIDRLNSANSEEEKAKLFYGIWTMKESYVKMTGDGLAKSFDSFSAFDKNMFFLKDSFEIKKDYAYTCCTKEKTEFIIIEKKYQ